MLKITAIGNLTNDVTLKTNEATGKPYAILRIASDRRYKDKDGNKRRTAEILAENIYFGDSKKEDDGGSAPAPTQGFGAPAQSGGFTPNFGSAQPGSFVPNFGGNY